MRHLADRGFTQGVHFDLDRHNGRLCRTPGFPYIVGRQYYGVKAGGNFGAAATIGFTSVQTPNVTNYLGGANAPLAVRDLSRANTGGGQVTLVWSSAECGGYSVLQSTNLTQWSSAVTNAFGAPWQTQRTLSAPADRGFFRVRRDTLNTYDPVVTP